MLNDVIIFHNFPSHPNTTLNSLWSQHTLQTFNYLISVHLKSISDYESPVINETDYHPHHNHPPPPFSRNGYNFGHRPLNRANKINRLYNTEYGIEVKHRGDLIGNFGYENNEQDEPPPQLPFDYNDDNNNREMGVNFYDNKYYDNLKMHR